MQLPTTSDSNTAQSDFITKADGDTYLAGMGYFAVFQRDNDNGGHDLTKETIHYDPVLKGPGLCPTEFIRRRSIHQDQIFKSETVGPAELPTWAHWLLEPQSSSTIHGGASVPPTPSAVSSRFTTPAPAVHSTPSPITTPVAAPSTGGTVTTPESDGDSSSSGVITFRYPRTPPSAPSTLPSAPSASGLTIKIPAQRHRQAVLADNKPARDKLTDLFLSAKKRIEAEAEETPKKTGSSTTNTRAHPSSPYTPWLYRVVDELHTGITALPSLTPYLEALASPALSGTTVPSAVPTLSTANIGTIQATPNSATVPKTTLGPLATAFSGSSRNTPKSSAPTTQALKKTPITRASSSSTSTKLKRIIHEISSDSDEDAEPAACSVMAKGKGKAVDAPATTNTNAVALKKRKSAH